MSLCEHCGSYNREHLTIRQVEALEGIRAALERITAALETINQKHVVLYEGAHTDATAFTS